jgi:hypothetical protein
MIKKINASSKPFIIVAIVSAMMFVFTLTSFAEIKREGNTFVNTKTERSIRVEQLTPYTYVCDGITYPVYTKTGTSFYIKKISKNTGEVYDYYLPKKVQEEIKKEFKLK